ncbi:MAG: long-chain fatty acid--CoA ligase [Gemmatimonadetes bacterium]|nr:long-chain fatty acid--CoA ligase [Gemmatimonadota bacterium]MCY3677221.1 long-chain fatty acid--CoA ligase [Gemmatimonadota bacterium]MYA44426.1 long-chain fatty acid--CoA ligase [Gemmatimonadota bacterium]MYE94814.1 long-chain fatty acid--CoA ligase [Gemmatimonadota bacterium]MYJ09947.1 long-chain fatty acid--CoA ligase [Gemmatimonadota bacterium]
MSETINYFANPSDIPEGTLVELFLDACGRLSGHDAYNPGGEAGTLTYAGVQDEVRRAAAGLAQFGIKRGDRVAILSENRLEWALADWACLCTGAVDVPIYSTLPAAQVAYILEDSGASLVFVSDAEQHEKARDAIARAGLDMTVVVFDGGTDLQGATRWDDFVAHGNGASMDDFVEEARRAGPEDLATMIYTSGTTGTPKGVMLTHNNLSSNIWATGQVLSLGEHDCSLSFLPLSHVLQRMVDYVFFTAGCTVTHGSIETVAADMKRLRPTVLVSVPRLYEKVYQSVLDAGGVKGKLISWAAGVGRRMALCREGGARPSFTLNLQYGIADRLVFAKIRQAVGGRLRYFVSGGAALAPEINRFFLGAGITILEGYGLSETSPVTNVNSLEHFRIGTVGRPVPGTEIRIADDGEILIRGPQVMMGYYGLDEMTREVISEDGWFSTGDIGELSADGYLKITDRKKDLIKTSGGKYVAPQAIENLLKKNPYVDQAVVVGDGRKFCSVLVVPAFERLQSWAAEEGLEADDSGALLAEPRSRALLKDQILGEMRDLARFETPKKIGLLAEPFTVENGALTPTQKVKRSVVTEQYGELIESFYRPESVEQTIFLAS